MPDNQKTRPENVMQDGLRRVVKEAQLSAGLKQAEVAERLGVSIPSVSKAENDPSGRYLSLQRIIEEIGGWQLRGPL